MRFRLNVTIRPALHICFYDECSSSTLAFLVQKGSGSFMSNLLKPRFFLLADATFNEAGYELFNRNL
jgi:hypothetical protein